MDEKLLKEYIAEAFKEAVTDLIAEKIDEWFYDRIYHYVHYEDIKDSFKFIDNEIQIHFNTLQHFLSKEKKERKYEK